MWLRKLVLYLVYVISSVYTQSGWAQEFRYAEDVSPSTLDPTLSNEMVELRLNELMFSGLFKDSLFLEPEGDLAKQWHVSVDKRSVNITLESRYWHDGQPVSSDDIKFTVNVLRHSSHNSRAVVDALSIKDIELLDQKRFVVHFKKAVNQPLRFLYFKILPRHAYHSPAFKRHPVGTGPFSFEKFSANEIHLKRVKITSGQDINEIRVLLSGPKSTQLDMLKFGYLEAIVRVPPNRVSEVRGLRNCQLYAYESLSWWYIGINHQNPALSKQGVREAIVYALNREKIREARLGEGTTISGPYVPRNPYYDERIEPRPFSLKRSQQRMLQAGYHKSGGFYVDQAGKLLKLRLLMNNRWSLVYRDVAVTLESELRKAGFWVSIEWKDSSGWFKAVEIEKDFDLTLGIWTFDEGANVRPLFHSMGKSNFINYKNKKMDNLLEESEQVRDPDFLLAIQKSIHHLASEELPYIFLWTVPSYSAISNSIYDVEIHPFNFFNSIAKWRSRR